MENSPLTPGTSTTLGKISLTLGIIAFAIPILAPLIGSVIFSASKFSLGFLWLYSWTYTSIPLLLLGIGAVVIGILAHTRNKGSRQNQATAGIILGAIMATLALAAFSLMIFINGACSANPMGCA